MAGITTLLYYQLYFDDAAQGALAQAANGGDLSLNLCPADALTTYPAGVILQVTTPFFDNAAGVVDLGGYTPTLGTPGIVHSPRYVPTTALATVVTETVYGANLDSQQVNTVTYRWNGTIVFTHTEIHLTPGAVTGKFESQIVTWVGDGSSDRLIPTTFPLDTGVVAIWGVGGQDGVGVTEVNFFRHNQSTSGIGAMLGTALVGVNTDPVVGQGIVSFEAGGFRVTAGSFVALFANTTGVTYYAIVLRDTTSDNHCLRCGSYIGTATGTLSLTVAQYSSGVTHSGGTSYQKWSGRILQDTTHGNKLYTFTYTGPTTGTISPVYADTPTNPTTLTFVSVGQIVPIAGKVSAPTHLWVWRIGCVYKSVDVPGILSVELLNGASGSVPLDSMITSLQVGGFTVADTTVSANHSVNTFNTQYDYLALSVDATLLAQNVFSSFAGSGAATPPTVVSGLPFDPSVIFARQGNLTGFTSGAFFRAPFHTSTNSALCGNPAGNNGGGSQGIRALAALSATFGTSAAVAAQPYYSWMFKGGTVLFTPTYTPNPPPDPGPAPGPPVPPTQPAACTAPILDTLSPALCATPAPLFP